MSKTMSKSITEEKYRWIKPILDKEISIKQLSMVCPFNERALKYWLASYRPYGLSGLANKSTRAKSHLKETAIRTKERIIGLRKETHLCAQKLNYKLKKEGIDINTRAIGKIIKTEGLVKKYRIRKLQYKYIKPTLLTGDLIEIDINYVPGRIRGKRYYQYTTIDCSSQWRYLAIYDQMTNANSLDFLRELIKIAPFKLRAIKTDNGSCFTNKYIDYLKSSDPSRPKLHPLDISCAKLGIPRYLIDPGKPAQNGRVERSHRTDQEMFYDRNNFETVLGLKKKIRQWNMYYNNLEHCSSDGLTPNEILAGV